jgi:rfaE bifunctional protein nucleotidyltransferase chain/domain
VDFTNKIVSPKDAYMFSQKLKKEGKTVVFANGCFDLLHVGHIRYLYEAKSKGDVLFVGINSDESVKKLKGEGRPYTPAEERAEILSALSFTDYIFVFEELDVKEILKKLLPHFHAKGTDYTEETVPEKDVAEQLGIKVIICGDKKEHSSSWMIGKIKNGK